MNDFDDFDDIKFIKDSNGEEHVYINHSNTPYALIDIYSTEYQVECAKPNTQIIEYTIYIGEPYFIHIIINKDGNYDYYRSTEEKNETKEGYFNDINVNKEISKSFYCKIIDIYDILINNLIKCNQTNGFEIMDLFIFYSSYKKTNTYFSKKNLEKINYNMNALILKIPTFKQKYGFSNIIADNCDFYDMLEKITTIDSI